MSSPTDFSYRFKWYNYYTNGISDSYISPYIFPTGFWRTYIVQDQVFKLKDYQDFPALKTFGKLQDIEDFKTSFVQGGVLGIKITS
jgi:hypothetical protein